MNITDLLRETVDPERKLRNGGAITEIGNSLEWRGLHSAKDVLALGRRKLNYFLGRGAIKTVEQLMQAHDFGIPWLAEPTIDDLVPFYRFEEVPAFVLASKPQSGARYTYEENKGLYDVRLGTLCRMTLNELALHVTEVDYFSGPGEDIIKTDDARASWLYTRAAEYKEAFLSRQTKLGIDVPKLLKEPSPIDLIAGASSEQLDQNLTTLLLANCDKDVPASVKKARTIGNLLASDSITTVREALLLGKRGISFTNNLNERGNRMATLEAAIASLGLAIPETVRFTDVAQCCTSLEQVPGLVLKSNYVWSLVAKAGFTPEYPHLVETFDIVRNRNLQQLLDEPIVDLMIRIAELNADEKVSKIYEAALSFRDVLREYCINFLAAKRWQNAAQ